MNTELTPELARRIGRGRQLVLLYQGMTGLGPEDGTDTAAADLITDVCHAVVAEPFDRAGLEPEDKLLLIAGLFSLIAERLERELEPE